MTCIIGIKGNGKVIIGGDTQASGGYEATARLDEKVFIRHDFIIGFTSSYRMGQLLQYVVEFPEQPKGMGDFEYMVVHFIEAIRTTFKEYGYTKIDSNREDGGCFLVGYRGELYTIYGDFQVEHPRDGFTAVGSGEEYAKGAMQALRHLPPKKRVKESLKISAKFNVGVGAPYTIMEL